MLQRLRAAVPRRAFTGARRRMPGLRFSSNQPPPTPPASQSASKISGVASRTPRFLRKYLAPLRHAPISHISAFLVLHELTAVLPLLALFGLFHVTNWLPPFISEWKWFSDGVGRFGKYLRKKGWIGEEKENAGGIWVGRVELGSRVVVELATAYAITKALLPVRLMLSVWATPCFARWTILPMTNGASKLFRRRKAIAPPTTATKNAAGTGATAAGLGSKKVG